LRWCFSLCEIGFQRNRREAEAASSLVQLLANGVEIVAKLLDDQRLEGMRRRRPDGRVLGVLKLSLKLKSAVLPAVRWRRRAAIGFE
jgi:hypothetical protein